MATLKAAIAENLSKLLRNKNISQTELAKRLEVSFQTVNGYVKGRAGISTEMIGKIATALRVEETDLTASSALTSAPTPSNADLLEEIRSLRTAVGPVLKILQIESGRELLSVLSTLEHNEVANLLEYASSLEAQRLGRLPDEDVQEANIVRKPKRKT